MLRHPTEGETYRLYRGGGEGGLTTTPMTTSGRFTMEGGTTNLAATSSRWNWMCFQVSLVESSAGGFHQWGVVPADLNCVPDFNTCKILYTLPSKREEGGLFC